MDTTDNEADIWDDFPKLEELCFEPFFRLVSKATSDQVQAIRGLIDEKLVGRVKNNFRYPIKFINSIKIPYIT